MMPEIPPLAIELKGLCKEFRIYDRPSHMLSELVLRRPRHRTIKALEGGVIFRGGTRSNPRHRWSKRGGKIDAVEVTNWRP